MNTLIAVRSQTPATPGECYWLAFEDEQARVRFRAEQSQPTEEGDYLVVGTAQPGPEARRHPRVPWTLRVLSRDLPNYQATTLDIGPGGLSLHTRLPLDPGEELPLSLDLPDSVLLVHCRLRILWSRPLEQGYAAGGRFLFVPARLEQALEGLELRPVQAWLDSCRVHEGQAELALRFPGRAAHQVRLGPVVSVTDRRAPGPTKVGYFSHTHRPGRERYCLLSARSEELLCIETVKAPQSTG